MIILSVGVRPETTLAQVCGIQTNHRGSILVDRQMKTNIPNIYAVGDAVEVEDYITKTPAFIPLAGPANKQGRIAADNIAGIPSAYTGTQGSAVLKLFDMTVATTGLNEKKAQAGGNRLRQGVYLFRTACHVLSRRNQYVYKGFVG